MSLKDVKLELDEIEVQQQGLEKQGVRLEQLIRSKCESGSRTDSNYHNTYISLLYLHVSFIWYMRLFFYRDECACNCTRCTLYSIHQNGIKIGIKRKIDMRK